LHTIEVKLSIKVPVVSVCDMYHASNRTNYVTCKKNIDYN